MKVDSDRHLLDTAATSLGILAIAVTSAAEVLLFLHRFGTNERTDGVFVAFALYSLGTVFAQILRTSAVALISGPSAPLRPADFMAALAGMGVVIVIVGFLGANALAQVIGHSLQPDGQTQAASSLRLLAPAMAFQLLGAGMAVIGAKRQRLRAVGLAYVVANVIGLVAFFVAAPITDERSLAWCVLIGSIALIPCLLPATGTTATKPGQPRHLARAVVLIVRSAAIPLTFVALYPTTLALAGDVPAGELTRFAFAYTVCSYLPGLTSVALSMTDVAVLSASASSVSAREEIALRSARWSALAIAPVLAVGATVGPDLFARLQSDAAGAGDLGPLFVELGGWLAATVLLWSTLPTLLAETRGDGLLRYVPLIGAVHVAATLTGRWLWGFDGVVIAMAVAPVAFAFVSWKRTEVFQRVPSIIGSVVVAAVVAVACFLPPARLIDAAGLAAAVGVALYAGAAFASGQLRLVSR